MSQQAERLDTLKARGRVGRITSMTDRDGRCEIGITKLGIILVESLDGAANLVNNDIARKGSHADFCQLLDFEGQVKKRSFHIFKWTMTHQPGNLPELGNLQARHFSERLWARLDRTLE